MGGSRDEQRFRELYDRTYNRLWSFVRRRVAGDESVDDVVSDTYLAVWRRIRDVPVEAPRADAWVFATARNMLSNVQRGVRRRSQLIDRMRAQPVVAVVPPADGDAGVVVDALSRLPVAQQEILVLAVWDDLSVEQIAEILRCSKNAAAIRLHRARDALKDALGEEGGGS